MVHGHGDVHAVLVLDPERLRRAHRHPVVTDNERFFEQQSRTDRREAPPTSINDLFL